GSSPEEQGRLSNRTFPMGLANSDSWTSRSSVTNDSLSLKNQVSVTTTDSTSSLHSAMEDCNKSKQSSAFFRPWLFMRRRMLRWSKVEPMDAASSPILSRTACSIFSIVNLLPQIRYFLFLTSPKTDPPVQQAVSWQRATRGQIRPASAVRSPIESV